MAGFLCPPGYAGPRGLRAIAREGSAVTEAARFVRRSARDRLARRDTPYALRTPPTGLAPVVLVPGFMACCCSTWRCWCGCSGSGSA